MVTAQKAFKSAVANQIKFNERGYGSRTMIINTCPDCGGTGKNDRRDCPTCGNEPDDSNDKIKSSGYWYKKL
jgi:DnaJ-class molecular chaperone